MNIKEIDIRKSEGNNKLPKTYRIIAASRNETTELKDMMIMPEVNCYRTHELFKKAIDECNVLEWEEKYTSVQKLDGIEIIISIIFEDRTKKNIICLDSYPEKMDRFLEIMDIKL